MKSWAIWVIVIAVILVGIIGYSLYPEATPADDGGDDSDVVIGKYVDVTVPEAKNMVDTKAGLIIIDVSASYADGHLPGAINYYVGDGSLDAAIPSLDKDAEYLVYCHFSSASRTGAQKLVDAGFKSVYRLKDNYGAWVEFGYPIER